MKTRWHWMDHGGLHVQQTAPHAAPELPCTSNLFPRPRVGIKSRSRSCLRKADRTGYRDRTRFGHGSAG